MLHIQYVHGQLRLAQLGSETMRKLKYRAQSNGALALATVCVISMDSKKTKNPCEEDLPSHVSDVRKPIYCPNYQLQNHGT